MVIAFALFSLLPQQAVVAVETTSLFTVSGDKKPHAAGIRAMQMPLVQLTQSNSSRCSGGAPGIAHYNILSPAEVDSVFRKNLN